MAPHREPQPAETDGQLDHRGKAVHVAPIKPTLKLPGTKRCLNLKYDELLSSFAFNFNLRRYIEYASVLANVLHFSAEQVLEMTQVGLCSLTLLTPR